MPVDEGSWQTVESLFSGDPEALAHLVQVFLDESDRHAASIHQGIQAEDTDTIRRAAHTLKSGARQLGGPELGDTCRAMEIAAQAGDLTVPQALATTLDAQLASLHHGLKQRLGL